MLHQSTVGALTLNQVREHCRQETLKFQRSQPSDGRFCLELFTRALVVAPNGYADEAAWEALVETYTSRIHTVVRKRASLRLPPAEIEDFTQQVWLRISKAGQRGLVFTYLGQALAYIDKAILCEQIDFIRRRTDHNETSIDTMRDEYGQEPPANSAANPIPLHEQRRFDARCLELLPDPTVNLIFRLNRRGHQPKEIAAILQRQTIQISNRPPTARAVSDILERAITLLSADQEIRDLLQSD